MEVLQALDDSTVLWVQNHISGGFLDGIMIGISRLGNGGVLWITIGIMILLLGIKRKSNWREWGFLLLLSLGVTAVLSNLIVKPAVGRLRPFEQLAFPIIISHPLDFSFPSGHTSAAFAAAWVCYAMNRKWGIAMLIFAVVMAFSRLYLGVHYPSDLLVGAALGTTVSLLILKCWKRIEQRKKIG